ncbi:MAG: hypothetical protein RMJ43_00580 [Chloroherpetonaceae bacterium]|nr:hypothetical protein [Chthonomonadaceae bacterium]MDW8206304.1 hypothetical protein [Chloroherpetonaceae bacterium]
MKALRGSLFTASLVLVEVILLALLLGGCGGGSSSVSTPSAGGGNVAGGGNAPDFRSVAQSAVDPIAARFSTMNAFSESRRARSGGCPRYILDGNTVIQ